MKYDFYQGLMGLGKGKGPFRSKFWLGRGFLGVFGPKRVKKGQKRGVLGGGQKRPFFRIFWVPAGGGAFGGVGVG